MPRASTRITETRAVRDVDAMPAVMSEGLESEYVQLEAKPFVGLWTTVRLQSLVVHYGFEGVAILRRLKIPADRWAFVVPIEVSEEARWNGRAVHEAGILVCPPGSESLAFEPGGTRFAIITSPEPMPLAEHAADIIARYPATPISIRSGAQCLELRDDLEKIRIYAESGRSAMLEPARAAASLKRTLIGCLSAPDAPIVKPAVQSEVVTRAERFLGSQVGERITIGELSEAAGVSERALRNAFYSVYQTSPSRYMRLSRLHHVRHELRTVYDHDHRHTVTNVALHHGCNELGRFAVEYKSLFGEAPSTTLNDARGRRFIQASLVAPAPNADKASLSHGIEGHGQRQRTCVLCSQRQM